MFWLKHSVKTGAIVSETHLRILTGISLFGVTFLLFILLIPFFIIIGLKRNFCWQYLLQLLLNLSWTREIWLLSY